MTPEQKQLVQDSFAQLAPSADQAAAMFYERLFYLDPSIRSLFKNNMQVQGTKLMATIGTAVNGLDRLEQLMPGIEELGRRHITYGVKESDYDTVGIALIGTLERQLGNSFTPEVKEAWITVYGILANSMKEGARAAA